MAQYKYNIIEIYCFIYLIVQCKENNILKYIYIYILNGWELLMKIYHEISQLFTVN